MNNRKGVIERVGDVWIELIHISAGKFLMGSSSDEQGHRRNEEPRHTVDVSEFYLGKYPVTQKQWFEVMKSLPETDEGFRGDDLPVVNVWLELAIEFCHRLSGLTGRSYRLPAEAEWEYACRAGTDTPFSFGNHLSTDSANFDGREPYIGTDQGEFRGRTTPAGFFQAANAFGVYDMHGNVWEWCADVWHEDYIGAPANGSVWTAGGDLGYCVQRGGSWRDRAANCRSAFRVGDIAHNSDNIVGVRVALSCHSTIS